MEVEMKKPMKNLSLPISMDDVLRGKGLIKRTEVTEGAGREA